MGKDNKLGLIIVLVVLIVIAGFVVARYMGGQGTDPGQVPERYGDPPGAVPPGSAPGM
ncbi:MAG: hypothetical protein HRF45_08085 [Fimbriimonadia bacterium]|jgi:hypothetical protein